MTQSICPTSANTQQCWEELKPLKKQLPPEQTASLVGDHGKPYKRGELSLRDAARWRLKKALGSLYSPWLMSKRRLNSAISFWTRVDVKGPDDCWPWRSSCFKRTRDLLPYGRCGDGLAHRRSWEIINGPIPEGLNVLHKCDNPPCCNPKHLFLGTDKDNMMDCARKGRAKTTPKLGSKHYASKLTESQVLAIRKSRERGESNRVSAEKYNISISLVSAIYHRKIWKHI